MSITGGYRHFALAERDWRLASLTFFLKGGTIRSDALLFPATRDGHILRLAHTVSLCFHRWLYLSRQKRPIVGTWNHLVSDRFCRSYGFMRRRERKVDSIQRSGHLLACFLYHFFICWADCGDPRFEKRQ